MPMGKRTCCSARNNSGIYSVVIFIYLSGGSLTASLPDSASDYSGSYFQAMSKLLHMPPKNIFDEEIINLMDFNCDQRKDVHFFYTLPFSKNKALVETTWLSDLEDQSLMDYDFQLKNYIVLVLFSLPVF